MAKFSGQGVAFFNRVWYSGGRLRYRLTVKSGVTRSFVLMGGMEKMPKGSPGTGHGGRTVEVCRAIGEPLARQLGLLLWDVRFVKEGATWYLRYIIDKDGGVGIDDCVALTRLLNPALDRADPIAQSYCLEVTSPGMERELTRPEHFERYRGSPVRVTLIRPQDGTREFTGALDGVEDQVLSLDRGARTFAMKDISSVRPVEDWDDDSVD